MTAKPASEALEAAKSSTATGKVGVEPFFCRSRTVLIVCLSFGVVRKDLHVSLAGQLILDRRLLYVHRTRIESRRIAPWPPFPCWYQDATFLPTVHQLTPSPLFDFLDIPDNTPFLYLPLLHPCPHPKHHMDPFASRNVRKTNGKIAICQSPSVPTMASFRKLTFCCAPNEFDPISPVR